MWGTMVDYWRLTGDTTWANMTQYALVFQGVNSYQDDNWTLSLGNDDQGFWGMSAMLAAETNFPDPSAELLEANPESGQWLALAQGVFNTQASPDRHDDICGGGLRWQIPPTNEGYDYKNAISNGIFFNLGARLARYTENTTYSDWAVKQWDWMTSIGLIDDQYNVYDGGHVEDNCKTITKTQFSYCAAVILQGTAFMYNYVRVSPPSPSQDRTRQNTDLCTMHQTDGSDLWGERLQGLVNRTLTYFFSEGIATEPSCELPDKVQCDTDQLSFKGYVHRWLATTAQLADIVNEPIMAALKTSAAAAATSCADVANENDYGTATCGFRWTTGAYEGPSGAGQQMNVLGALMSLLVAVDPGAAAASAPVTNSTGGTSVGNPNAGGKPTVSRQLPAITTKDRVGAGILTALVLVFLVTAVWWLSSEMLESAAPLEANLMEKSTLK